MGTHTSTVPLPSGRWLTVSEAAATARVCVKTIRRWVDIGLLESVRPIARGSGRRLIDRASLERFIAGEPAKVNA